jgi:nucleotide-binding universal stress UspA family protein
MTGPGRAVVVGVGDNDNDNDSDSDSDSDSSLVAVDTAATEAALRHLPLHIVHADPFESAADTTAGPLPREPGRCVNRAMERAQAAHPDLKVIGEVVRRYPQSALVEASSDAELVVIGARGLTAVARALLDTVAGGLVRQASCPVLVTRGPGVPDGPVVVGVDGSPNSQAAVDFAFAEADLHGRPLLIVHAWSRPGPHQPGSALPRDFDAASIQAGAERLISEATAGRPEEYPDVDLSHQVVHGHARQALIASGHKASLLVVGAHGRRLPPVPEPGSVTRYLLYHAPCPLVVVPAPAR